MAEQQMGINLLLDLPGVSVDQVARHALEQLDAAMARGDTCIEVDENEQDHLLQSGLVGSSTACLPIVLDGDLLSSRRYWCYEDTLAMHLLQRAADTSRVAALKQDSVVAEDISKLFPRKTDARVDGVDWQRVAACVALGHGLSIITGGPGTGKTTVAGRVIAIAERFMQRQQQRDLVVYIAAPTGKAAQRLRESLIDTAQPLIKKKFLNNDQVEHLTSQVATLHRLLYDRRVPHADLLVIDEVSMADAATLTRVLSRVSRETQIILLGDPKQLASVDAGHVLGEIARFANPHVITRIRDWYLACGGGKEPLPFRDDLSPLASAQVHLLKNWRSAASPAVSALAASIQDSAFQVQCLFSDTALNPDAGQTAQRGDRSVPVWIQRCDLPKPAQLIKEMLALHQNWAARICQANSAEEALAIHAQQRILCARNSSHYSVQAINNAIEAALDDEGIIHKWEDGHYHGRPLLVTRNNYDLQLFNGDIGIVQGDRTQADALFPDARGQLRAVPLHRLDAVEPVYAMSIHKSQGSQFEHVDVVTAADDSGNLEQLLTRELLYTGVTRAAYSVRLWANEDLMIRSLERRTTRRTGLGRFLSS